MACGAHNQHAANQVYGAGSMAVKREEARRKAEARRTARAAASERAEVAEQTQDLIVCLRNLRVRTDEIRRATEHCAATPFASLEERVRAALQFLGRRHRAHTVPPIRKRGVILPGRAPDRTEERENSRARLAADQGDPAWPWGERGFSGAAARR